jgi:hypothetical protein
MFRDKLYDGITEHIEQNGRSIIGVFAVEGDEEPPFAYTVGNACHPIQRGSTAMPELLAIGTPHGGFLNELSQMMIDADAAFEDGQVVLIPGARLPVKIVRANNVARTEYALQAGQYFGHNNYPIMQVLIPDRDGKFPGDVGCQPPFSDIPVLRPN